MARSARPVLRPTHINPRTIVISGTSQCPVTGAPPPRAAARHDVPGVPGAPGGRLGPSGKRRRLWARGDRRGRLSFSPGGGESPAGETRSRRPDGASRAPPCSGRRRRAGLVYAPIAAWLDGPASLLAGPVPARVSASRRKAQDQARGGILTLSVGALRHGRGPREIRRTLAADPASPIARASHYRNGGERGQQEQTKLAEAEARRAVRTAPSGSPSGESPRPATPAVRGQPRGAGRVSDGRQRAAMAKLSLDGAVLTREMVERTFPRSASLRPEYNHRLNAVVSVRARRPSTACRSSAASHRRRLVERDAPATATTPSGARKQERPQPHGRRAAGHPHQIIPEGPDVVPEQIRADPDRQRDGEGLPGRHLSRSTSRVQAKFAEDPGSRPARRAERQVRPSRHQLLQPEDRNESVGGPQLRLQIAAVSGSSLPRTTSATCSGAGGWRVPHQIDLEADYHKYLDVQVVCTADFEQGLVDW
jgi:hypothetical protein